MPTTTATSREQRARRRAEERGLRLCKARSRFAGDWLAGSFMFVSRQTGAVVHADHRSGEGYGLDLCEVEDYLAQRS